LAATTSHVLRRSTIGGGRHLNGRVGKWIGCFAAL